MKICMIEPIAVSEELLKELTRPLEQAGHEVELCLEILSEDEKRTRAEKADVLIVANGRLTGGFVERAEKLKLISVAFTGVDHLPKETCVGRGITVCNAQGYATIAVRDLVFGFVFGLLRNLVACDEIVRQGGTKDGLVGNEIFGKTFGIIGYGQIGRAVAEVAAVLGCNVLAYSRSAKLGQTDGKATFVTFDEVITKSDIISLHTPLTPETKGMIGQAEFEKMKPQAILINTARGQVVDSASLVNALNSGQIAAAGIDVFDVEPPLGLDEPLFTAKNVLMAPHIGFATKESMIKRAGIVFDNIEKWIEGSPQNVCFTT